LPRNLLTTVRNIAFGLSEIAHRHWAVL